MEFSLGNLEQQPVPSNMHFKIKRVTFQGKYELFKVFTTNLWAAATISVHIRYTYTWLTKCKFMGEKQLRERELIFNGSNFTCAHPIIVNHTISFFSSIVQGLVI